jgi:hypothetical protein
LSLASPHVILAQHGELTLVVITKSKIPDGYQMAVQVRSFLWSSMSTRRVLPQSTVPVEYGDLKIED